jgi:hypothetical protein
MVACETKKAMDRYGVRRKWCSKHAAGKSTCLNCTDLDEFKVIAPGGYVSFKSTPRILHRVTDVTKVGVVTIRNLEGPGVWVLSPSECATLLVARRGIPRGCRVVAHGRSAWGAPLLFAVKK